MRFFSPRPQGKSTGVRDPSRSSVSLTPLSLSTISGTWTIIRFNSLQRFSSMYCFTPKTAFMVSFGVSRDW